MRSFRHGLVARLLSFLLICSLTAVSFGSAAQARFIQPDTMDPTMPGVGTNRYAYANNDPINKSDPNGHFWGAAIGIGIGIASALFGGTKPANAPADSSEAQQMSDSSSLANSVASATAATSGVGLLGRMVSFFGKKQENPKQTTATQQGHGHGIETPSVGEVSPDIAIESKIENQMAKRGWDESSIRETVSKPDRTVRGLRDTRFDPATGVRRSDSATGFVNKDGSYVVRNDVNGSIVQVSDRTNPNWKAPF